MKAIKNHPKTAPALWVAWVACGFRLYACLAIFCLICFAGQLQAQQTMPGSIFHHGERVDYDLYFKWGILMPKAGLATLSVKESEYKGTPSWKYQLLFRTSGMMEKVYKMRDTMECFFSQKEPKLLYSSKRSDEGDYYLIDNLTFSYKGNQVSTHSHRYTPKVTKIDTLLTAENRMFDMLGATMYLRTLNWDKINKDDEFPFRIAIGREIINASFRYAGQQIVEHGNAKYSTRHFYIDIFDEAFTQSKAAAEVWIGDDENHLPVKIRAKLKIGAAEVYFRSAYNLQYPLTCRIELKK